MHRRPLLSIGAQLLISLCYLKVFLIPVFVRLFRNHDSIPFGYICGYGELAMSGAWTSWFLKSNAKIRVDLGNRFLWTEIYSLFCCLCGRADSNVYIEMVWRQAGAELFRRDLIKRSVTVGTLYGAIARVWWGIVDSLMMAVSWEEFCTSSPIHCFFCRYLLVTVLRAKYLLLHIIMCAHKVLLVLLGSIWRRHCSKRCQEIKPY